MNKKILKIGMVLLIITLIFSFVTINSKVLALTPETIEAKTNESAENKISDVGGNIIGILQTIGVVLSVVILIVLGLKYMMGSAEEKSEYKKTMVPYVIGAALIFAASVVAQVVYNFFIGL